MSKIEIEWLSDSTDCEQCGGGYADGARVTLDGELLLEMIPRASCFGSTFDWGEAAVYEAILRTLGYELNERHGD